MIFIKPKHAMSPFLSSFHLVSIVLSFMFLAGLARSAPSPANLVYPLQAQRPPVARVGLLWTWTLLPGTFNASTGSTIILSTRSLPTWATFDAGSWTFSGSPSASDAGSHTVTVQANVTGVAEGTFATFNLLVAAGSAPYVRLPIATQLPTASKEGSGTIVTADGSLRIPPYWSFSLGFQQYTFQDSAGSVIFYTAYLAGTTSLPTWLKFDNTTVTFGGVVPNSPGIYPIVVYGSNKYGYGDVSQTFTLTIGYHSFELLTPLPSIDSVASGVIRYVVPISGLSLDNATVSSSAVRTEVDLTSFPGFTFNNVTRVIYGVLASNLTAGNVTMPVKFTDQYNDTVSTSIRFSIQTPLFASSNLPALTVSAGKVFSENISSFATSRTATYYAAISPSEAQNWLRFDSSTLAIEGTAPSEIPSYGNASVLFTAFDPTTRVSGQATLQVAVAPLASGTSSSAIATSTAATGSLQPSTSHSGLSRTAKLAIGLSVGIIGGLVLLCLLIACCRRFCLGERRLPRDRSTVIFSQATIDAAQKVTPNPSTGRTLVATPAFKGEKPLEDKKAIVDVDEAQTDATVGMGAVAVGAAVAEGSKPKRIGLMNLFKGSTPKKEVSQISLPVQSQNSLYGLGIGNDRERTDSPTRHNIIVVANGAPTTYNDGPASGEVLEEGDFRQSSSWESAASSSLFYSDGSESVSAGGTPRGRGPPSAPRQRRDFLPLPVRRNTPSPAPTASSSSSRSHDGIRMVDDSLDYTESEQSGFASDQSGLRYDNASYPDLPGSADSIMSLSGPRLIPFTSERVASQSSTERRHSQNVTQNQHRNSATIDADEYDPSYRPQSGVWHPPSGHGSPATSAVFFSTPREGNDGWTSPVPSEYSVGEGVRLVGSSANSPNPRSRSRSPWGHNRTPTGTSILNNPTRMLVEVGKAFRFTPQMNPPPFVSITSSPGRGGPPRASYFALVDDPDDPDRHGGPLPDWIHFDQSSLQMWGMPRERDVGSLCFYIVERKAMQAPGSPTRRGGTVVQPDPVEQVVGRYILEVNRPGERGVLQVISY
ncbi:hypothetical protein T439DRAFT_382424 [Meredithblackwellia eburnea MCA 4105]